MAEKEQKSLKKLKRSELLEIMLAQSEEIERLRAELAQKDAELKDKRIAIAESGSIAEASLKLTNIFKEAQKAADLYLANVKRGGGQQQEQAKRRTSSAQARAEAHERAQADRDRRRQAIENMQQADAKASATATATKKKKRGKKH